MNNRGVVAIEAAILLVLLIPIGGLLIDVPRVFSAKTQLEAAAHTMASAGVQNIGKWELIDGLPTFTLTLAEARAAINNMATRVKVAGETPTVESVEITEADLSVSVRLSYNFTPILPVPLSMTLNGSAIEARAQ